MNPVTENTLALVDAAFQVVVDASQMADFVVTSTYDVGISSVADEILMFDLDGVDDQSADSMSAFDKLHAEVIFISTKKKCYKK